MTRQMGKSEELSSVAPTENDLRYSILSYPWQKNGSGNEGQLPPGLLASVRMIMSAETPMAILWTGDFYFIGNKAFAKLFNQDIEAINGKPAKELWRKEWNDLERFLYAAYNENKSLKTKCNFFGDETIAPYQPEKSIDISFSPFSDESGQTEGVFCCVDNSAATVNEQKVNDDRIGRNLILQAPVAVCLLNNSDFRIDELNQRFADLTGKDSSELKGKPIFDLLSNANDLKRLVRKTLSRGEQFSCSAELLLPEGNDSRNIRILYMEFDVLREADHSVSGVIIIAHDLSKHKVEQQKLEDSAQEIRALVESAPFPIGVYTGREMRIKMANRSIIQVWGKGSDIIGKLYSDVLPELQSSGIYEQLEKVFTTGVPFHAKNQRVDLLNDGRLRPYYFNYSFTPLFDKAGNVYGVMNTAVDITDLHDALQNQKEAEEKARLAIDSADLGSYEVILTEKKLTGSKKFFELWGIYSSNNTDDFVERIHPEDRKIRDAAHELSLQNGNMHYEVRIHPGENLLRWIRVNGRVIFSEDKKPVRIIGVVQDISEQKRFSAELERKVSERTSAMKQAQQELQASYNYLQSIINNFETPFVSLVPVYEENEIVDFKYKMSNEAYSHYSKISPEYIHELKVSEAFPEYQQTDAFERYKTTYLTGKTQKWDLHYNVDGLDLYLGIICNKIGNEVMVHFIDFSPLKSLQEELLRNIEELKRSNKNLEDFAFAASHDLKEPIRKIQIFSDRLKMEIKNTISDDQLSVFTKLENATNRMRALVDDLLSYAQVTQRPREFEMVDLDQLLREDVLSELELEIEERNAQLRIDKLPLIPGLARQLHQLFHNLLANSLKYRDDSRPVMIEIFSEELKGADIDFIPFTDRHKNFYKITVADNGIGFKNQEAEIIFQVFQRLHSGSHYRGTGVGLSIVRKVVENHKGYVTAFGTPGEGARFDVYLPAAMPEKIPAGEPLD